MLKKKKEGTNKRWECQCSKTHYEVHAEKKKAKRWKRKKPSKSVGLFFFNGIDESAFWVVGFPLSSQHVLKATFTEVDWVLLPTNCTFFSLQEMSCDVRLIAKPQPMRSKKRDYTDTHEKRTRCFSFSCTHSFPSFCSDNEGLTMARLHREVKKAVSTAHVCLVSLCHTIHFGKQNKRATK